MSGPKSIKKKKKGKHIHEETKSDTVSDGCVKVEADAGEDERGQCMTAGSNVRVPFMSYDHLTRCNKKKKKLSAKFMYAER